MRRPVAALALVVALALALLGCSTDDANPTQRPPANLPPADTLLQSLATALSSKDVTALPTVGGAELAQADLVEVVDGMGDVSPRVAPKSLTYDKDRRTATGELEWTWPVFPQPWTYTSRATLEYVGKDWQVAWSPATVHPSLTVRSRLDATRLVPDRARIIGADGTAVVEPRDVIRIGLDKNAVPDAAQQEASARAIATLTGIDADAYVANVKQAGPKAFVVALIDRGTQAPPGLADIPGGFAKRDRLMLTPYRGFGGNLVGTLGEPTQEIIEKSGGAVTAQDTVGRSGLQYWHDDTLRGTPGIRIELVERDDAPRPAPGAPQEVLPALVHKEDPVPGKDLVITLDVALQTKLENLLHDAAVKTAIAVVQPSTGKVLALAQSANGGSDSLANWGHYPPGSTFKVVTSLALVRTGMSADSPVPCPTEITVDGRQIQNYPEYPPSHNGTIPLKDALAFSCNTAFVDGSTHLSDDALAQAAGSLGFGVDHDAGFLSFYGSVPPPTNTVGKAEQSFGQGTVEGSPMAVAGIAASVAAKRTVVPWLVEPGPLQPTATPLTEDEALQLQAMMQQVVGVGSATSLQGVLVGAKTGTAEFGTPEGLKTHVWLMGYTGDDRAIAVFGDTGKYGTDLAPLLKGALQ